ncbi:hypothetical protein B0J15DRAFT_239884 [Fusarium solani]|uniref:Uncharacterized protein n=1 Tax=Fusarium solani TaxID=169388 RepID=A0A9P9KL99_FUSSL|nr:uncharacterized protein B0J15DRAFT_239884 [Fusarium solani]KAH7266158.1 hypothetical protein B0J15DRAFT_239884 [Fusarium solani]
MRKAKAKRATTAKAQGAQGSSAIVVNSARMPYTGREQKEDEEDRQAARTLEIGGQIQSSPVQWLLVAQMVALGIRTARHWRRGTDTDERLKVTPRPRYGNGKEPREQRRGPLACWICGVEPTRALEPCWWTSSQKKSSADWQQIPSGFAEIGNRKVKGQDRLSTGRAAGGGRGKGWTRFDVGGTRRIREATSGPGREENKIGVKKRGRSRSKGRARKGEKMTLERSKERATQSEGSERSSAGGSTDDG